jgi:tryptophan-rich sensory protein
MFEKIRHLIYAVLLSHIAGALGAMVTVSEIPGWYATLAKPWFTPPSWIFAPVWFLLYTLMGCAAFLVWEQRRRIYARTALILFMIQLGLNALWSVFFFGMHDVGLALMGSAVLWIMIAYTIRSFEKINTMAAWLLAPYFLWVSFATLLTYSIWSLNW